MQTRLGRGGGLVVEEGKGDIGSREIHKVLSSDIQLELKTLQCCFSGMIQVKYPLEEVVISEI